MRLFSAGTLSLAICAGFAFVQQGMPTPKPEHVKVYSSEAGVKLPQLLPLSLPVPVANECKKKIDGKVELSLLVDTDGRARNIMFVKPLGTDADRLALQIADADRFTPGNFDGQPVVAATHIRLNIHSCQVEAKDNNGNASYAVRLRSNPDQELLPAADSPESAVLTSGTFRWNDKDSESPRIKDLESRNSPHLNTAPPIPLIQPMAQYTKEARKAQINGICLISLIVDAQGMPRDIHVHRSLDPGLDQNAMIAVGRYRFKPAIRDGEPIAVFVLMEVKYHIW
jgi:TonB family protein